MRSYISTIMAVCHCCLFVVCAGALLAVPALAATGIGSTGGAGSDSLYPKSSLLDGNNSRAAHAVEQHLSSLAQSTKREMLSAYSALNASSCADELNSKARGLTPHASTFLGPMAINRFDMAQGLLFNRLGDKGHKLALEDPLALTAARPRLSPAPTQTGVRRDFLQASAVAGTPVPELAVTTASMAATGWNAWLSPMAGFERYDAKSASWDNASGSTQGMTFGTVRHLTEFSLGVTGYYMRSLPTGGGWTADAETYGFMAGLQTGKVQILGYSPKLQIGAGYAYSNIEQKRSDILGREHGSSPRQHGVRLSASVSQGFSPLAWLTITPTLGLDYTYIHQSAYCEDGGGLSLSIGQASMSSVRPRLGGELKLTPFKDISIKTHAFVRQELGNRALNLRSNITGTPVNFIAKGQKYSRSSGSGGVSLTWDAVDSMSLSAHYDIIVGDRYPGYYVDSPANMSFDGDSYDGSSGNGGIAFNWQMAESVSFNASCDAVFDGDAPGALMNAVLTWEF